MIAGNVPVGYVEDDFCQVQFAATVGGTLNTTVPDGATWLVDTSYLGDIVTGQATLAVSIAAVPGLVWDTFTSAARAAGSYGAKLKAWALGTDNKALLSTDVANTALLGVNDEGVLTSLSGMITAGKFTAPALSNAPSGGGTGGSGTSAVQIRQEMDANSSQFAALMSALALANGMAGVNQHCSTRYLRAVS